MRDRIVDALGDLAHPRFLVYLMGPYKAFDVDLEQQEAVFDLLLFVRDLARREQRRELPVLDENPS